MAPTSVLSEVGSVRAFFFVSIHTFKFSGIP